MVQKRYDLQSDARIGQKAGKRDVVQEEQNAVGETIIDGAGMAGCLGGRGLKGNNDVEKRYVE